MKKMPRSTVRKGGQNQVSKKRKAGVKDEVKRGSQGKVKAGDKEEVKGVSQEKGTTGVKEEAKGVSQEKVKEGATEGGEAKASPMPKVTEIVVRCWEGPVDEWEMLNALRDTIRRQIKAMKRSDAAIAKVTGLGRSYIYKIRTSIKVPSLQLILRWFTSQKVSSGFIIAVHEKALRRRCL